MASPLPLPRGLLWGQLPGQHRPLGLPEADGGGAPPAPWAGVPRPGAHCPIVLCSPCSSCCSLRSLGQLSPRAFPWSPWEGAGWTLLAQAWARWQLQLWVALFLEAAFRAVVQPGSGVPGIGETGELPPGSSAPFHHGDALFLLTAREPCSLGSPAGLTAWQGGCCTSMWPVCQRGEAPQGLAVSPEERPCQERAVCTLGHPAAWLSFCSLCSSGVGLLTDQAVCLYGVPGGRLPRVCC